MYKSVLNLAEHPVAHLPWFIDSYLGTLKNWSSLSSSDWAQGATTVVGHGGGAAPAPVAIAGAGGKGVAAEEAEDAAGPAKVGGEQEEEEV